MRSLTWEEVCGRRLARHSLIEPAPAAGLLDVVRAVGGVHAQVMAAAELSIGIRVAGVTQQEVREELWERRRLIKTYGPRGTLHLLPADELPLWMAAMRAASFLRETRWYESAGLEPARAAALLEAIGEALDGRCLTREALADEVARRAGAWAREGLVSAWGGLLRPAAYTGLLCFGPSRGSKVTFVRADQWAGAWKELDPGEALAEVFRRYLAAYGPATHQDFAEWFHIPPGEARRLVQLLADELEAVDVEGRRAWVLAADARTPWATDPHSLRLLPLYDCYLLGVRQRDRLVPEAARARVATHPRGRYEGPVAMAWMLVDGVVGGMWARHKRGSRIALRVDPFVRLTAPQRGQLEAEAVRMGEFLDAEVTLST